MELYPGYLEDHFNIHKLRCVSISLDEFPLDFSYIFCPSDSLCEFINSIVTTVALIVCLNSANRKQGGRQRGDLATSIA